MYLSLSWLKDFVDIPKKINPDDLALKMTLHTVEVDAVINQADKYQHVVVGKIIEIKRHPNADRLQLTKVDIGSEKLDIVCGANNIAVGQKVPVALTGAILPNGMEIKEAEVRGIRSCGMLCAADELGLGDDHSGIKILDNKAKIGQGLAEHLALNDTIIEVDNKSITHRPDLWSHYGMARDIAAASNFKFKPLKADVPITEKNASLPVVSVKVEEYELCPRYIAVAISGIKIASSPQWMQDRLIAAGTRPINNIVDITNYIMMELGQPMHAFDVSRITPDGKADVNNCRIIVRKAKKGELLETLDGEKRPLNENMLLIASPQGPIAVAGVMGGANSEISDDTVTILLESANFDFISVRKTSQMLGLRTEASTRYEKSLDPNLCELALYRAVELIKKLCPQSELASQITDMKKFQLNQGPIELDLKWLAARLGEKIKTSQIIKTLTNLGFGVSQIEGKLQIAIPSWRATKDISLPEDLLEEIARVHGYDKLIPQMPVIAMHPPKTNKERVLERRIKHILSAAPALSEVYNYSFVGEEQMKKLGINYSNNIRLANPIAAQHTMLRTSLAPNLISAIRLNQARFSDLGIFEIGSIYLSFPGDLNKNDKSDDKLPFQEKFLGIALAGNNRSEAFDRIKGILSYLFDNLDLQAVYTGTETLPSWADERYSADVSVVLPWNKEMKNLGQVCRLANRIWSNAGIKKETFVSEINLRELMDIINKMPDKKLIESDKFPPLNRDLAFVVDEKVLYNSIRTELLDFSPLIKSVELFDVYQGDKLGPDKKSLAFHLVYQADKTLTSQEVDQIQEELVKYLEDKFEAKIRNF